MSVPLDRLYSFLHGVCNHDVIMYHWAVHGSKKAKDLVAFDSTPHSWQVMTTLPQVICHDQEPLDFACYATNWKQEYDSWIPKHTGPRGELFRKPEIAEFLQPYHLRSLIDRNGGVNIYDQCILLHSEKNSDQVDQYAQAGFVPVYWWSHAMIAKDWFRYAQVDPLLKQKSLIDHTFLIYNRAWSGSREYRLKFAELVVEHELAHDCKMSLSWYDNEEHYAEHQMINADFKLNNKDLGQYFPPNVTPSWSSAEYQISDYRSTLCEIVLETMFDHQRIHLTEKTLRPIACQQPFIILAGPGALHYLRSYGFKTFDGIINETYDTIKNSYERMLAVIAEMKRISGLSLADKELFVKQTKEICEFNQARFFSQEFTQMIVEEYQHNLSSAIGVVSQHKTGKMWQGLRDTAEKYYPDLAKSALRQNPEEIAWVQDQILTRDPSQSASGGFCL